MIDLVLPWTWLALGISVPLVGSVEDGASRPIAGAAVILGDTYQDGLEHEHLAAARTDAAGRFRLDRPDHLAGRERSWSPTIWAVAPRHRLAFRELRYLVPTPDEPVRFVLGPPVAATIRILQADGQPTPGVIVRPIETLLTAPQPPGDLATLLGATTDPAGRCVLPGLRTDELSRVDVAAPVLVAQGLPIALDADGLVARLRPVGRLTVRVVGADAPALPGWRITATTTPDEVPEWTRSTSWVRATTDAAGAADLRPLAAGRITRWIQPLAASPDLVEDPTGIIVRPDQLTEVTLPLRRAVRVAGVIRQAEGGSRRAQLRTGAMTARWLAT